MRNTSSGEEDTPPGRVLLRFFEKITEIQDLRTQLLQGNCSEITGLIPGARPALLAFLIPHLPLPALFICPTNKKAERMIEDLAFFLPQDIMKNVLYFPERQIGFPDETEGQAGRFQVLEALSGGKAVFVVAPLRAVLQQTLERGRLLEEILHLEVRLGVDPGRLCAELIARGYDRAAMVVRRGEFSIRGCILDIFPSNSDPVRLEFFGDEIESMRVLDLDTQRSKGTLDRLRILPMHEEGRSTYLPEHLAEGSFVFLDEPAQGKLHCLECGLEEEKLLRWDDLMCLLAPRRVIQLSGWFEPEGRYVLKTQPLPGFFGRIDDFVSFLSKVQAMDLAVAVVSQQARRMREILEEKNLRKVQFGTASDLSCGSITLIHGSLCEGFRIADRLCVFTDWELLGAPKRMHLRPVEKAGRLRLEDLCEGDLVVHAQHGIGRFLGLQQISHQEVTRDFLKIEYARGDFLYVPVEHMDLLQKYIGLEVRVPHLSRLGGSEWAGTRRKVKESVRELARGLLRLYAARETMPGHAFSPDFSWQAELESSFPYEETEDQKKAIIEVKKDMEKPRPMDRLVCGDAGYGKTEVALRAAFKAIMGGKQVAILVPTTVLAQQHYSNFRERLAPFPVRLEMLSRFRSPKEQKEIVEALKAGTVDIVIGTHRLLQGDVGFRDLGLVIIDEEQHFGVAHKEKLKELKSSVDVLTMTATPIPRTLHMSLLGVKDLSTIDTPPENRLPVKTFLCEYDSRLVRGAILRELERDGQIYFVHNRVHGIERVAQEARRLVPRARVVVAHGQMDEEALEGIMLEFMQGLWDVLVCTTIIQSGIDIPNVNTIIINNAHTFGLSQLYQLRGRVGRSHHQAYAYFLYPPHRALTLPAERRLETIREFTDLGCGFQIAMKDMEIRGVGNLLGPEQHGFIAAVGLDLYQQLLQEAVMELKGEAPRRKMEAPILDIPVQAFLPDDYVSSPRQKISLYRRMADAQNLQEVKEIEEDLRDRFGPLPSSAVQLLAVLRLKIHCLHLDAPMIRWKDGTLSIRLPFARALDAYNLAELQRITGCSVSYDQGSLRIHGLTAREGWLSFLEKALEVLLEWKEEKT